MFCYWYMQNTSFSYITKSILQLIINQFRRRSVNNEIFIEIHFVSNVAERRTLKRASSASKRPPLFQSKELLSKLCTHIKDSLLITTELVLLEFDGLPFRRKDLTILAQVD